MVVHAGHLNNPSIIVLVNLALRERTVKVLRAITEKKSSLISFDFFNFCRRFCRRNDC